MQKRRVVGTLLLVVGFVLSLTMREPGLSTGILTMFVAILMVVERPLVPRTIIAMLATAMLALPAALLNPNPRAQQRLSIARDERSAERTPSRQTPSQNRERRLTPDLVTVDALVSAYEANEIAADQRYEGRRVEFTAPIDDIGTEILGRPYLTFSAGASLWGVQAVFPREAASELAAVRKGQIVTVDCEVSGKMMNVLVDDCRLLGP